MSQLRPYDHYEVRKYQVHIAPKAHARLEALPDQICHRIEEGLGDLAEIAQAEIVRTILRSSPHQSNGTIVPVTVAEEYLAMLDIDEAHQTITLVDITRNRFPGSSDSGTVASSLMVAALSQGVGSGTGRSTRMPQTRSGSRR